MTPEEQEIHDTWMEDESGKIDLCRFCIHDQEHKLHDECTGFKWNGKRLTQVYPNADEFGYVRIERKWDREIEAIEKEQAEIREAMGVVGDDPSSHG